MSKNKDYSLKEWAKELDYNRNHDEWSDARIAHTQWQDHSAGFNDTVPFEELVLYVAVQYLLCPSKEFYLEPPYSVTQEFTDKLISRVRQLINEKGYYRTQNNPDSFRVMGIKSKIKDAQKPYYDLHENPFSDVGDEEQREHTERGIKSYLGEYAESFPFGSDYEVRTYQEAKLIFKEITTIRQALKTAGINKTDITKKSTNNSRGYKAITITEVKKNIRAILHEKFILHSLSKKRKARIVSRATEIIIN